jgi:PAS domain S-box-containing protein
MCSQLLLRPPLVMVVDDDPVQLEFLAAVFGAEGYRVSGQKDGTTALAQAVSEQPDILVTDLNMPGLDGFELVRRLKANASTRSIPIILMTAWNDKYAESEGLRLGAVDYITKPFSVPVIRARVNAQLALKLHRDHLENLVEQRTAELARSRKQFKDLVEKSLVGIAIFSRYRLVYYNPELKRIIGDLDQKVAERDFSFLHPDDFPKIVQAYRTLADEEYARVEMDFRILRSSQNASTQETIWINGRAVRFVYQRRNAVLVNIIDITLAKEMERQLLLRNKMASLGRVASGLAHEIRNPLNGITAYLYSLEQLCAQKTLSAKDRALMSEIVTQLKMASFKVESVIKRVLDFSKPTTPCLTSMNLNQRIDVALKLTMPILRKSAIALGAKLAADLPDCRADATLIEQVILNLIQNAVRAVGISSREKRIDLRSFCEQGRVCLSISDSGPGVAHDLRDKIFDPFFTTHSDGSGIGLSIAQRIMTDHRGALTVAESDLGGAKFTLCLPVDTEDVNP